MQHAYSHVFLLELQVPSGSHIVKTQLQNFEFTPGSQRAHEGRCILVTVVERKWTTQIRASFSTRKEYHQSHESSESMNKLNCHTGMFACIVSTSEENHCVQLAVS